MHKHEGNDGVCIADNWFDLKLVASHQISLELQQYAALNTKFPSIRSKNYIYIYVCLPTLMVHKALEDS